MDIAVEGGTLYVEVDGPESNPALLLWPRAAARSALGTTWYRG